MVSDVHPRAPKPASPENMLRLIDDHTDLSPTALGRKIGWHPLTRKLRECQEQGKLEWELALSLADELGVSLQEVLEAFAADAGVQLGSDRTRYQRRLIDLLDKYPLAVQEQFLNATGALLSVIPKRPEDHAPGTAE